jgi:hypothetical protein
MLQVHSFAPGFLLGLVTVAALAVTPARGPEPGTRAAGEAVGAPAAIPGSQEDMDGNAEQSNSTSFVDIPNSVVTINNGTSTRNVVVTFSAETLLLDPGDAFLLAFRIDSGSCVVRGPQVFSEGIAGVQTRTAVHLFTIGPGTHSIRPCWAVLPDGDGAQFIVVNFRTLTAEGRTR